MKEIGGYFELELAKKDHYHKHAIKVNSGRNAFKYLLKAQDIIKVYIPCYICNSIIEPLEELSITYEFYNVDNRFEIIQDIELQENEKILYVNYFSLKTDYIKTLAKKYKNRLIVDNTQAFFAKPLIEIDTIYSPRKFFGVGDGGYLFSNYYLDEFLEIDESYIYSSQLLGRIDQNAASFYSDYQKAEQRLMNQPIKQMSNLTQRILSSIDYQNIKMKRKKNFEYLHKNLKDTNLLVLSDNLDFIPFVYPFMTKDESLREKLINNKIYIAKYWNEVLERISLTNIEIDFVDQLIPLPIDQRYNLGEMKKIVKIVKEIL